MKKEFSVRERINSFKYAFSGFKILIKEEHNFRIHFVFSIIAVVLSAIFNISATEWIFICFSIVLVISMEAVNSAIENLSDFVSSGMHERIKKVKDISAFAVLFCAVLSLIVGCIIFLPKMIGLFTK